MGRIRSIKPEFPQSESIGRLSRDARLLFLQLFTLVDDEGRSRGASRMLASLLYPYDPDAPMLIGGWLDELERENHIRRYVVDGHTYLEVINFVSHQKIDHPSKSKLPAFANPRESSRKFAQDQGRDQGRDQGEDHGSPASAREPEKQIPDSADCRILCESVGIFGMREQAEMLRCLIAYCASSGKTTEAAIQHMVSRWREYSAEAPNLEWQYGSAYKFFMSGKWDDPRAWPRGKVASIASVGSNMRFDSPEQKAAKDREAYAMWQSMSKSFRQANPWEGPVPA